LKKTHCKIGVDKRKKEGRKDENEYSKDDAKGRRGGE
jgi:hypothetical protein